MTDYLPKEATIEQACAWLEARTGETWILPRLMEFHLTPYFWNDYKPGYPAIYGDRKEGYQTHMIFQGDRTRLESDGGFALVTMYAAFDGSWVTAEPGWPLPLSDLRFRREEVEEVAEIINAKKSASESEKSRVPQSFKPQQGNTQPVSALMSGAGGWGRAVNGPQNKTNSPSASRARAFLQIDDTPPEGNESLVSPYEVALLTHDRAHYWLGVDGWTAEVAAYLLLGIEPMLYKTFVSLCPDSAGLPYEFPAVLNALDMAGKTGVLSFPATPEKVIRWAQAKKKQLPQPLLDYAASLDKAALVFTAPVVVPEPQAETLKAGAENLKPVQRSAAQDTEILAVIRKAGHDPLALPVNEPGKPGVKAETRAELVGKSHLFQKQSTVFNKAWERLRQRGDIADKA